MKLFFFPLSNSLICSPHLSAKYLQKLFEIIIHGRFVSSSWFIYLLHPLYYYRVMDTYFILSVMMQYYFLLSSFSHFSSCGFFLVGSCVPLTHATHYRIFEHFTFLHHRIFKLILYNFWSISRISDFPKGFLLLENDIRN